MPPSGRELERGDDPAVLSNRELATHVLQGRLVPKWEHSGETMGAIRREDSVEQRDRLRKGSGRQPVYHERHRPR